MTTILENGKVYELDIATGLVTEAKDAEQKVASAEDSTPLALNERVEVQGQLGKVVSRIASVYGMVLGVRFDDGTTQEFLEDEVTRSAAEVFRYDTPSDQVKADWDKYQELPSYTLEQVDTKAQLARSLNVTAKALVTDQRTSLSDQVLLDTVVITTGTDLIDFKDQTERLTVGDTYVERLPEYAVPNQIIATSEFSRDDASWLALSAEETEEDANDINWNSLLSYEAIKATARLTQDQLKSDDFMDAVAGFREEAMPVGFTEEHRGQFRNLLEEARANTLNEREATKLARTASVKEELSTFQDEQLYL